MYRILLFLVKMDLKEEEKLISLFVKASGLLVVLWRRLIAKLSCSSDNFTLIVTPITFAHSYYFIFLSKKANNCI